MAFPYIHSQQSTTERFSLEKLIMGCGVLLAAVAIFLAGAGLGFGFGRWTAPATAQAGEPGRTASTQNVEQVPVAIAQEDFAIFWEAMDLLERDFYGPLPSSRERTYGAIRGVLNLLDDPNTSFLQPDQAAAFLEGIEGSFEGIGATVEWDEERGGVRIVQPFENQPAWNAGLRRGDLIVAIDSQEVSAMANLAEAINKIKGVKGTTVVLTIVRENKPEPFEVEVVRDTIQIPIVFTDTYGDQGQIAYIRLSRFSDNSGQLVRQAVERALDDDADGLVFDLRGNPGGLLREAVKVANVFLENQPVVIERFSDGSEEVYRTEGNASLPSGIPMVVLVNEGSASASEIVAGALQDAGRAPLIGATTFGKGSVQLPHHLSDDSILRVTVAKWYTPANRTIDGSGLEPDIDVEVTEEQIRSDEDPQLDRALQLLQTGQ